MSSIPPSASSKAKSAATPPSAMPSSFFRRSDKSWEILDIQPKPAGPEHDAEKGRAAKANNALRDELLSSLQMQHLIVLAGSGTSLGPVGGPSMSALWDFCVNSNPGTGDTPRTERAGAKAVINQVGYQSAGEWWKENIEALLSLCDAYLQFKPDTADVAAFVRESKEVILRKCREFIDPGKADQLDAHRMFLHKLSRRRVRDSRLKLFTTNYDLCFESAAGKQGLVIIDGFSFAQPRYFDPRFFQYDIVRRTLVTGDLGTPLEGVFQLLKLHGSVVWEREGDAVRTDANPTPDKACLIYPAKGKYQQSYVQPHLELVSQFFASLREPNTCVLTIGFGFNDDHLSEPILAAVRTNPHLKLIVVSPSARVSAEEADTSKQNKYWKAWYELAQDGHDILIVAAKFDEFVKKIPDLKSLTPAEQLAKSVAAIAGGH